MLLASAFAPTFANAAVGTRTLFLTEDVRPNAVRGPLKGPVQPQNMVVQQGEEEGFLLALKPTTQMYLSAVVDPSSTDLAQQWTQALRTEYVTVTRTSTAVGRGAGRYADPLPPQMPAAGNAGKLLIQAREWKAFAIIVSVPAAQAAGTYTGVVLVRNGTAVVARVPYSIRVVATRTKDGVADPAISPHDARNFKVLFNFNPAWYRGVAPAADAQKQYEQTYRTMWMMARHRVAPTNWHRAYPSADGTYKCSAADGYLKVFDDIPWWADGQPGALPVAMLPSNTPARCDQDAFAIKDEAGKETKFDDKVGNKVKSAWFIYRVAEQWRASKMIDHRSYFLNPFDEPDQNQNSTGVPEVNSLVHDYAPGVKVLGTTWPMVSGDTKVCRTVKGARRCATKKGNAQNNVNLRDGGKDDLDGWIAPYFRAWGFGVTPAQKAAGINRAREVQQRLQQIQAKGGEAWTYDLPLGTKRVPQITIDGPATDARFMFWPLARDGYQGWFIAVSNRWIDPTNYAQVRNPWDAPLSWIGTESADKDNAGPHGVVSNGWGSMFYPGYRPALGLNDPLSQPVSSLRLERMRDGVEDANLMHQYKDRFGTPALNKKLKGVIGPLVSLKELPGDETFYSYSNNGLALRMEVLRRQMLAELSR